MDSAGFKALAVNASCSGGRIPADKTSRCVQEASKSPQVSYLLVSGSSDLHTLWTSLVGGDSNWGSTYLPPPPCTPDRRVDRLVCHFLGNLLGILTMQGKRHKDIIYILKAICDPECIVLDLLSEVN